MIKDPTDDYKQKHGNKNTIYITDPASSEIDNQKLISLVNYTFLEQKTQRMRMAIQVKSGNVAQVRIFTELSVMMSEI